jgi:hypothetical protein
MTALSRRLNLHLHHQQICLPGALSGVKFRGVGWWTGSAIGYRRAGRLCRDMAIIATPE